ncbi:hypothetical protein KBD34_04325 [Patescibacteria group bacterium]|nr:hypothetical protein [Patescibacteria group bacterium]
MRSSSHIARFGALALLFPLLGAGCGGGDGMNANSDVSMGNNSGTIQPSDMEGTKIPADFPSDFPRYPDAKTILAYTENGGKSGSLMQETKETLAQAQSRIESMMQGQGFTKDNVASSPDLVILSFSKGSVRYQVNIAQQAGTTQIQSTRVET